MELKSLSNFKTKRDILEYLKEDGCPTNQIKRIDWNPGAEPMEYIEFHNPKDFPEVIDLYMKNGDQWSIGIYLDENMEIDYITKTSFSIID